jgi:outer membrane lipoprotein SlyB
MLSSEAEETPEMRYALVIGVAFLSFAVASHTAQAIGCLSGAAAGALAGHMAGHGIVGAIGGCIAGHEWHKHTVRQQDMQNEQDYVKRRQQFDPNYKDPWQNQ